MSSWQVILLEPARVMLGQVSQFLVKILGVLVILIAGWLISKVIKGAVTKILRAVKLDELSDRIELDGVLEKGGITYSLSELLGVVCYWLGLLITFMVAFQAIGLTAVEDILARVINYIPNVVTAVFILVLGLFVATVLKNIVQAAANNAGLSQTKVLSKVVEVIVIAFSIFIALEQLKVGVRITQITVSIVLGTIGLGLALAFGLGCKDVVGKYVEDLLDKLKKK